VSSPADPGGRPQLLDDLRQVIRRIEGRRPFRVAAPPAESVVGGAVVETPHGPLLAVRRDYPLDHRHGAQPLLAARDVPGSALRVLARADGAVPAPERLLFLDTETTGLAGGTGTYAFLVGAGWVEDGRFVVVQYFMRDFDEEPALLAALEPRLAEASGVVTFNGTGFDLPLLETRFILARRRWPPGLPQVDLLRPARRLWARCLDDCRLATLERHVLGLERGPDVPAALIPSLYFAYLRTRRVEPLAPVFAHNRDDVLSLAALLGWFVRALAPEAEASLAAAELAGLGRLWEDHDLVRSVACYEAALAAGLGGPFGQWVRMRLGWWWKRQARWEAACALWQAVAGEPGFDLRPWEELAKYHEHRRRDFAAARTIVSTALDRARAGGAPAAVAAARAHRLARLERRLRLPPAAPLAAG
jgi:uncharacterized protein